MDIAIQKKRRSPWLWLGVAATLAVATTGATSVWKNAQVRTASVTSSNLIVSSVTQGKFEDIIPIRGQVQPFHSVLLDAVSGGVMTKILVEEGAQVQAGQPLLQLSNTDLQLAVARNDTQITEQLNNLKNISNGLKLTKVQTERQIIDTKYRIVALQRLQSRQESLVGEGLIQRDRYEETKDELKYRQEILSNLKARQKLESGIRQERLKQIRGQVQKLEENLEVSRNSFDQLLVRAPITGQLTSLVAKLGESKVRGQRLGQIDVVEKYKIVAQVSEYYVSRVAPHQPASFQLSNRTFQALTTKVYSEIKDGNFELELVFSGEVPNDIRRGQSLQMKLTLGNSTKSLLLPVGAFLQNTGGTWAFVLDNNGDFAARQPLQLGRRNHQFIEVRGGLEAGQRVITSSYSQLMDEQRVKLN